MNYDENIFKEKANRKARKIWLIFALLLSANYGSDVANGLQKADYYIIFLSHFYSFFYSFSSIYNYSIIFFIFI